MILVDNRNILRLKDRNLLNQMSMLDDRELTGNVIVEQAKTGVPTIKVSIDDRTQYLQSKYDPEREAERFVGKFDDEIIKNVLFVGVGIGYHIQKFMEAHPDAKFSIYEPNEEVFHAYLTNFQLGTLPIRNMVKVFVGTDEKQVESEVQQLLAESNNVLKIITLPVYEKIYGPQINAIFEKALESLKDRHNSLATNVSFQKRWTINSIKNFPTVLKTPNILHDIDRSAFEGKPAIIVAAGPSLNEEFENLRYIKEHGLAYIFSVGSAINALIEQGIYPDAACTYDPKERNQNVIKIIKDKDIKEIPLIFGTSVGYETIENYPGHLLHMATSQDSLSVHLLNDNNELEIINDAPSIAVITLQLLIRLGFTKIILVGQNLSFKNNERFADGIKYNHINNTLNEEQKKKLIQVKDVYGGTVFTEEMYIRMADQLELYIKYNPKVTFINTTKGGASIKGTKFTELRSLINSDLSDKEVCKNWYLGKPKYDINTVNEKLLTLVKDHGAFRIQIQDIIKVLNSFQFSTWSNKIKKIEELQNSLDKKTAALQENDFYIIFIKPMLKTQLSKLREDILKLKYENNARKKSMSILKAFQPFIFSCLEVYQLNSPLFTELKGRVEGIMHNEKN